MKGLSELAVAIFTLAIAPTAPAADSADQKFVNQAAVDNLAEVSVAKVAGEKASQDAVRQYAQQLSEEHQQATEKLQSLASQKGIQMPTEPDAKHKRELDKLSQKSGADFDKAFIDAMVKDHKAAIKQFEKEAKNGKDADLKAYAAETLPKLKQHLNEAQQLQGSTKAAKKSAS